ncbi:hypothetical protein [Parasitella parasitica]|uniref:DNA 3'-5' helicase n=1 Tax=Parasitella parasitica TaxID=35722 RepID=A0A0B7N251_9FUNG|nr:hypothetical protein [Parasitella parasitica]
MLSVTVPYYLEPHLGKFFGNFTVVRPPSYDRPNSKFAVYEVVDIESAVAKYVYEKCRDKYINQISSAVGYLKRLRITHAVYYADMTREQKEKSQGDFLHSTVQMMVCTTAFGPGIDKGDISYVLNAKCYFSVLNALQMAG